MTSSPDPLSEIRLIVAHAVGLTPADMADDVDVMTTFSAGWREIGLALSKIEQKYGVTIATDELGERPTILSIYRAAARHAGWAA
jgi:hypothetical protein